MDKKYTIDEIIDNIVRVEDYETKEMIELDKTCLPEDIHEGAILIYDSNGYRLDIEEEKEKKESLRERIERLKKLNNKSEEEESYIDISPDDIDEE